METEAFCNLRDIPHGREIAEMQRRLFHDGQPIRARDKAQKQHVWEMLNLTLSEEHIRLLCWIPDSVWSDMHATRRKLGDTVARSLTWDAAKREGSLITAKARSAARTQQAKLERRALIQRLTARITA
jgi:hypothetical protein